MGVYAQTNYEIEIGGDTKKQTEAIAKKVIKVIKKLSKDDKQGNNFGTELSFDAFDESGGYVYGFMASGRIQNLEWRCETLWNAIKDIPEVLEFSCPFMSEADGFYESKK